MRHEKDLARCLLKTGEFGDILCDSNDISFRIWLIFKDQQIKVYVVLLVCLLISSLHDIVYNALDTHMWLDLRTDLPTSRVQWQPKPNFCKIILRGGWFSFAYRVTSGVCAYKGDLASKRGLDWCIKKEWLNPFENSDGRSGQWRMCQAILQRRKQDNIYIWNHLLVMLHCIHDGSSVHHLAAKSWGSKGEGGERHFP